MPKQVRSLPSPTNTGADLMELRVDRSEQYSSLSFGIPRFHQLGSFSSSSEVGPITVVFDFSEDRRISAIEFAARMSSFLGETYYQRLFSRPCPDGPPLQKPGVALVYDHTIWYENDDFFALYFDRSLDQARLCLSPLAEIGTCLVEEDLGIPGQSQSERVVLEWEDSRLVALRFESASALLPSPLLNQAAGS